MSSVIQILAKTIENNQPAVLATIVDVKGASPAKLGAQIVLLANGKTVGTVGGGKLEAEIIQVAQKAMETHTTGLYHFALTEQGPDSIGTLCGGEVTVFVQPYFPPPQLVIVGGGHIGRPLQVMGEAAGWKVVVVDVAAGQNHVQELEQVTLTSDSYVVLITTDHVSDEAAMRSALKSPAPYIGMIGSLTKCETIAQHLRQDGYGDDDFKRIYAPIGLDLGGSSPNEIAVAILAEVIACRNRKGLPERTIKTRRIG